MVSFIGQITGKFFDFLLRLRAALDLEFDDFPRDIFLLLVSVGVQLEEVGIHVQQVDLLGLQIPELIFWDLSLNEALFGLSPLVLGGVKLVFIIYQA